MRTVAEIRIRVEVTDEDWAMLDDGRLDVICDEVDYCEVGLVGSLKSYLEERGFGDLVVVREGGD